MKVDTVEVKPAFVPVTLTLDNEGDLAFFRDVLARTSNVTYEAYGQKSDNVYAAYDKLDELCRERGIKGGKVTIKYERKG